ncbi:MAG: bifunctional DNA primase/polymerase [Candidatus Jordarchaeaceae archaeon]
MNELIKLIRKGWVLIPISPNTKVPEIRWKELVENPPKQTIAYLRKNFKNKNVAVATGQVSGITVVDCDSEEAFNSIKNLFDYKATGLVKTPHGYHVYFRYNDKLKTGTNLRKGIDIRNNGAYVLVPPSTIDNKQYRWLVKPDHLLDIPESLLSFLTETNDHNKFVFREEHLNLGNRDNALFHIALTLAKGGMHYDEILEVLKPYAKMCNPPFSENELKVKIESALRRIGERQTSLIDEVRQYVEASTGVFTFQTICRDLNIFSLNDKKNVSKILHLLVEKGVLEKAGRWNATYRKKDLSLQPIDLSVQDIPEPFDIKFPFELEKFVEIYPKNIVVVAGVQNVGKTLFFLNFVVLNQDRYSIHYFNSEMSEEELRIRLRQFKDVSWNFKAYTRTSNFVDVIQPNEINIIDYLEITDEFWRIGAELTKIHEKLDKGICIIGIQKDSQKLLGRGASFGLEKPRLYLSMDTNRLMIVKAKNWKRPEFNPNFKCIDFRIKGTQFITDGVWYDYVEPKR